MNLLANKIVFITGARADLIARASQFFGDFDIVVNNAATSKMKLPSDVSSEERNFMHDLNVNVPVELAQQALPAMRANGAGWVLRNGNEIT